MAQFGQHCSPVAKVVSPALALLLAISVQYATADVYGVVDGFAQDLLDGKAWSSIPAWETLMEQRSVLAASALLGLASSAVAAVAWVVWGLLGWMRGRLYTVVEVRQHDQLYQWLLDWLAAQREVCEKGNRVFAEVHPDFHKVAKISEILRLRFLPVDDGSVYLFRMGGTLLWISHCRKEGEMRFGKGGFVGGELRLHIMVLGRGKAAINALFQAAFEHSKAKLCGSTEVFVAQPHEHAEHSHWRRLEPRRARPLETVVASSSPGPDALLDDMRSFLAREDWYAERGVPYRRGYLFHGPPGCGKTSFVTAAAGQLCCPIYVLNLADPWLSDLGLLKLVTDAQARSILLIEDIDAAFHEALGKPGGGGGRREGQHMGQLTFSGVLNALDGVAGQEGKLVVMTTNHPEKLDPALVRPGRVDMRAKFHCATRPAIEEIFCNFFKGSALDACKLRCLATKFAESCDDGALSIAAVQGHLMQFVDKPEEASKAALQMEEGTPTAPTRQFVIPRGAAAAGGGEEEE